MSNTGFHRFAQGDTPSIVEVPKTWGALIVWAVGRFGVGIVVAFVFWHAWREERTESHLRNERLVTILEQRARVDAEMTLNLGDLRTAIDELRRDASLAHRQIRQ